MVEKSNTERTKRIEINEEAYTLFHRFSSNPYLGLGLIVVLAISFFQPLHLQYWQDGTAWPFFWGFVFKVLSLCLLLGAYFLAVPKWEKRFREDYKITFFVLQIFHIFLLSLVWGMLFSWLAGVSSAFLLTWLFATNFHKGGIASYVESFLWWLGAREAANHIGNTWKEEIQDNLFGSLVYTWVVMTFLLGGYFFLVLQGLSRM